MSDPGHSRVLIPIDGSNLAYRALDEALTLAGIENAVIHVLYVVNHRNLVKLAADPGAEVVGPKTDVGALYEGHKNAGADAIADLTEAASVAGVEVVSEVRHRAPTETILEYISEVNIDLVVMGTHGRSGFHRLLRGSTTEQVLRRVSVPLLAVPINDPRSVPD